MRSLRAGAPAAYLLALAAGACDERTSPATPTLAVSCSATPASGPAPLRVGFALTVQGAEGELRVSIQYGDGSSGTDVSAAHVYERAGTYAASFDVSTASQAALCSTVVTVTAPQPVATPPPPVANAPPTAVFNTTPDPQRNDVFLGRPPLTITFNMCRSSDPDGDSLHFRMDLDGDGVFEVDGGTGSDCRRSRTYRRVGIVVPHVCLTDLRDNLTPAHEYQCRNYVVNLK